MDKKRVLVVDDMALNRAAISSFLLSMSYRVDSAEDGQKGLKLIETTKYDLVFSDIEMPNMNGYEFLIKIRKSVLNSKTPVIMLSSLKKPGDIEKAKKLGANHYIIKPFNSEKMHEALKCVGF